MVVDSVSSTQSTTGNKSPPSATVGYNDFLQLLIAQMRNQDPTSPTDMAQYMSQFAQLSSVEQAIQTNAKLDTLLSTSALSTGSAEFTFMDWYGLISTHAMSRRRRSTRSASSDMSSSV